MSRRGRLAYLIHQVDRVRGPAGLGSYTLRLKCWRVARTELPAAAVVWGWTWDKRTRRTASPHGA